jgi:malonate transporter
MFNLLIFFILVAIGGVLYQTSLIPLQFFLKIESFIIKVFFPCLIFLAIYSNEITFDIMERHFFYSYILSVIIIFLIAFWHYRADSLAVNIIKSFACINNNTIFFSIPIVTFYLQDPSSALIINIFQPMVFLPLLLMMLNLINGHHHLRDFFGNFYSSTIFLSIILAFLCRGFHVVLPDVLIDGLSWCTKITLFLAPICFGATILGLEKHELLNYRYHLSGLIIRLFLAPLLAFIFGHFFFHLDRYWLVSLVLIMAGPTGLFMPIIAQEFAIIPDKIRTFMILSALSSLVWVGLIILFMKIFNL